jgi:hypothetical protein
MDRYIEAWSQPGAATGMINYYRSSVRTPPKRAEAAFVRSRRPPWSSGAGRRLPRPRPSRTRPRRRAQPGSRRAPARRVALGASRRGRARHTAAHRLFRPRPAEQGLTKTLRPAPDARAQVVDRLAIQCGSSAAAIAVTAHPAPAQEVLVLLSLQPQLAESVVRARHWRYFQNFLHGTRPALKRRRTWNATSSSTSA